MMKMESDIQTDTLLDTGRRKHRVRTGCFCCRKRKKKCDEAQPACQACVRNRIKCVYPTIENETLPEGFTLKEAAYESIPHRKRRKRRSAEIDPADDYEQILRKRQSLFNIIIVNPSTPKRQSDLTKSTSKLHSVIDTTENTPQWNEVDEILNASPLAQSNTEIDQPTSEFSQTTSELSSEFAQSSSELESSELQLYSPESPDYPPLESPWNDLPLMSIHNYIPTNLSPQNSELYMSFINHFIPSISLPHSHPRLAPGHIWVNMGLESKILTDIFLCCGASYMAYAHRVSAISNPYVDQHWAVEISDRFEATAEIKYRQVLKSLGNAIANKEIDIDSDWLFTAGLNLCLRDRSQGLNGSRCAKHLIFVYNLVKRRESLKKWSSVKRHQDDRIMVLDGNDEVELVSTNPSPITITPTERLLMDSFVFNYSAALLSCSLQDLVTLPSPYGFFPRMRRWLNQPIYTDCEFIWMNKPVTGCALDSFEICAKLTWLLRLHYQIPFGSQDSEGYQFNEKYYMNDETFWKLVIPIKSEISQVESKLDALELELDSMALRQGSLHSSVEGPRSNLALAIMMLNSAKIMYEKLIDPSIPAHLPRIQDSVNRVIDELRYIPHSDQQSACLSSLGLFIAGISTINDAQRETLINVFNKMSNELASGVGLNILRVLRAGWEREEMSGEQTYRCFDMLFDRLSIEQIAF